MPVVVMTVLAHFGWPDNADQWVAAANVAIQEIAAKYGCHVADIHEATDHDRRYYADMIHPNKEGALKIAETVVRALASKPLSPENLRLAFDQGAEIRFMSYVFLPEWRGGGRSWVKVCDMSPEGMTIDSQAPMTVHILAYKRQNVPVVISCKGKSGRELLGVQANTGGKRALRFRFEPDGDGPYVISIKGEGLR